MLIANENCRLNLWARVRGFAVPPSMIESATARRAAGDWAAACTAAHVDVDLNLRAAGRAHGRELAAQVRADLRHLAPDLLRWHFPRIAPDGLLRPGLTVSLARYGPIHLVARTPPAWAAAGQRISLALWTPSRRDAGLHPHPRPDRRYRLDLHRHLWDARRAGELRERSGDEVGAHAVDRWVAEAALLLHAEGRTSGVVAVRLAARHRVLLKVGGAEEGAGMVPGLGEVACARAVPDLGNTPPTRMLPDSGNPPPTQAVPVLPDAATWALPDRRLLHAGLIDPDRLHPLVASALRPGHRPAGAPPPRSRNPQLVDCSGATHRIGVVNGVLAPLDHDPGELHREELLATLGGPRLSCLRAIDEAHREPENLVDVRARLDHGDADGALAVVEELLGPDALLPAGALRDELATAVRRRVVHGLYRAGLAGSGPGPSKKDTRRRR